MLSRTAENLFWIARYMERAENIARLLDAGRRMAALPADPDAPSTEWESVLIAAGCEETFPDDLSGADQAATAHHLIFDDQNPSSVRECLRKARENARAIRIAMTSEVWSSINDAWIEMRALGPDAATGGRFAGLLEWVKSRGQMFRGAVDSSLLRTDGYDFLRLGIYLERADVTARILDVKYNVLLPDVNRVGGGLDHMQWISILRSCNAERAYRWSYREAVSPRLVADFLILNAASPRALAYCYENVCERLDKLGAKYGRRANCHLLANRVRSRLADTDIDEVFAYGLHEYLTDFIGENSRVSHAIAAAYGFGGAPLPPVETAGAGQA